MIHDFESRGDPADESEPRGEMPGLAAVTFVDNAGITRAKAVPQARLESSATAGIGASTTFAVFQGDDQLAHSQGLETPTGDIRLMPVLDGVRPLGDGWSWAPARIADQEGESWPLCTRSFLERMVAGAAELQIDLRAGSELEFVTEDRDGRPGHEGPAYGLGALGAQAEYLVSLEGQLRRAELGLDQNPCRVLPRSVRDRAQSAARRSSRRRRRGRPARGAHDRPALRAAHLILPAGVGGVARQRLPRPLQPLA